MQIENVVEWRYCSQDFKSRMSNVIHLQEYKTEDHLTELFKQVRRRNAYNQEKMEATKKWPNERKDMSTFPSLKSYISIFIRQRINGNIINL